MNDRVCLVFPRMMIVRTEPFEPVGIFPQCPVCNKRIKTGKDRLLDPVPGETVQVDNRSFGGRRNHFADLIDLHMEELFDVFQAGARTVGFPVCRETGDMRGRYRGHCQQFPVYIGFVFPAV